MQPHFMRAGLLAVALSGVALANQADMTIACESILVPGATATDVTDLNYSIQYTSDTSDTDSDGNPNYFNGEWFANSGTVGYEATFALASTDLDVTYFGTLDVDIPDAGDLDTNFITDFFEVDRAQNATTSGTISIGNQSSSVTAVWSRAAGQTTGSVSLTFSFASAQIGEITFVHSFEIFEYGGKLTYTPAGADGSITASVDLSRIGGEGKFTGSFPMNRTDKSSLERLTADWTGPNNEAFQVLGTLEVQDAPLALDLVAHRPWYVGSFFFLDGIPSTPFTEEFDLWDVFVNDPNDANQDGVPDLSDPPTVSPPTAPTAQIEVVNGSLQLTVSAKAGASVTIESRAGLAAGAWETVQTFTLTNDSETVALTSPAADTAFWRVSAQ